MELINVNKSDKPEFYLNKTFILFNFFIFKRNCKNLNEKHKIH